jgi:hypothetical protein
MLLLVLLVVVAGAYLSLFFGVFLAWDAYVKHQHDNHNSVWIADGSPGGFWYRPRGANRLTALRLDLVPREDASVPAWAIADPVAVRLFHRLVSRIRLHRRALFAFIPLLIFIGMAITRQD